MSVTPVRLPLNLAEANKLKEELFPETSPINIYDNLIRRIYWPTQCGLNHLVKRQIVHYQERERKFIQFIKNEKSALNLSFAKAFIEYANNIAKIFEMTLEPFEPYTKDSNRFINHEATLIIKDKLCCLELETPEDGQRCFLMSLDTHKYYPFPDITQDHNTDEEVGHQVNHPHIHDFVFLDESLFITADRSFLSVWAIRNEEIIYIGELINFVRDKIILDLDPNEEYLKTDYKDLYYVNGVLMTTECTDDNKFIMMALDFGRKLSDLDLSDLYDSYCVCNNEEWTELLDRKLKALSKDKILELPLPENLRERNKVVANRIKEILKTQEFGQHAKRERSPPPQLVKGPQVIADLG